MRPPLPARLRPAPWIAAACLHLATAPAGAAGLEVEVTLPDQASAAYHPPYLTAWIERADGQPVANGTLAVWYDTRLRDNLGKIFLKELRTWWRKTGQSLTLPADGVSGPTRGAGSYTLRFSDRQELLAGLPAGSYQLAVEVAREQGGRSMLRVPFQWKTGEGAGASVQRQESQGESGGELAVLKVSVKP